MARTGRTPIFIRIVKVISWTIMAAVLTVVATLICLTSLLSPEHLTIIANRLANKVLDAEVTIGRVELGISGRAPLLTLKVNDVTILSKPMLRAEDRENFPEWADTLLTVERFEGGLNLPALIFGKIDLHDVDFERPGINLFTANDSLSNYMIYTSDDTTETKIPKITINRFRIIDPKPIRFKNLATNQDFTIGLKDLTIEGNNPPDYNFKLGGDLIYPEWQEYNLDNFSFGVDGKLTWDPDEPTGLQINDFKLQTGCIDATLNAKATFGKDIVIDNYSMFMYDTSLTGLLDMIPDSLRRAYDIGPDKLSTDIRFSLGIRSTAPLNLTVDSVPNAEIEIEIIPGSLRYGKLYFHNVSGKLFTYLRGNNLNEATFVAENLNIAGPSTDLLFNFRVFNPTTDPLVDGSVKGHTDLSKLPPQLLDQIDGYIRGKLTTDINFNGRQSMLNRNNFHKLSLSGVMNLDNLYYVSSDTNNMADIHKASLTFNTHTQVKSDSTASRADSMLTAAIRIDSANYLHSYYSIQLADLSFAVGVMNQKESTDTTLVIPMGGDIKAEKFILTALSDSLSLNIRGAHGHVTMRRFKQMDRVPEFIVNLDIKRFSTGSVDTRFMLSGAKFDFTAHKLPSKRIPRRVRHAADSIHRNYPDIPMDSVYRRAIEIQREKHKHHGPPRVHPEYTTEETEIIDWGTSSFIRKLLLEWKIKGVLTAKRAGLFTPYFPVRNRLRNFNIKFDNDSLNLTNVEFKMGSSDFLVSGIISNLKQGLTSKGYRSPLRLNFDVVSDTIDINQLADATFRGSAYAQTVREDKPHVTLNIDSILTDEALTDEEFERDMGKVIIDAPDKMAPFMVPVNVELSLNARSKNILYSDLLLKNFKGEVLISQGGLNLHDLHAKSEFGSVGLSALYSSPKADDIKFGFGMNVHDFNIHKFIRLVPAVDSVMPLLKDINGIIDAQIAATCDIDSAMNIVLPSLEAAIRISGDSLELIDKETYRNIGKWLLFKDKQDNIIKHMNVELTVKDNIMRIYPFIFDLDRYKLGIQGYNDLSLNFDYHIAVLKSPIPFKFGINIKGNPDHYKIRLGKANLNEKTVAQSIAIVDTTRINLLTQIQDVFRRGVNNSRFAKLNISRNPLAADIDLSSDTISHADSLLFIQEGLIPAPEPPTAKENNTKIKNRKGEKENLSEDKMFIPLLAIICRRRKRKRDKQI